MAWRFTGRSHGGFAAKVRPMIGMVAGGALVLEV